MSYTFELIPPQDHGARCALSLWADPLFMRSIQSLHDLEVYHLVVGKGNETAAIFPVYERSALGIRHLVCPVMAYYQPLLFLHDPGVSPARRLLDEMAVISGISETLTKRYRKIEFNLSPDTKDVRGFCWSGLKASPLYTFTYPTGEELRPIRDESEKLKKAVKRGYDFREGSYPDEFIELLKGLYQRKSHKLGLSYERLGRFIRDLDQNGLLIQESLFREGRMVSSDIIYAGGGKTAFAVMRATEQEEMAFGVSNLHTQEMLRNLGGRYDEVDFCGANIRDVARFKAALGLHLGLFFRISGKGGIL